MANGAASIDANAIDMQTVHQIEPPSSPRNAETRAVSASLRVLCGSSLAEPRIEHRRNTDKRRELLTGANRENRGVAVELPQRRAGSKTAPRRNPRRRQSS